jgi:hypothetical protein
MAIPHAIQRWASIKMCFVGSSKDRAVMGDHNPSGHGRGCGMLYALD